MTQPDSTIFSPLEWLIILVCVIALSVLIAVAIDRRAPFTIDDDD